jgi:uncharacterized repeat protein (TIGR01451 family)
VKLATANMIKQANTHLSMRMTLLFVVFVFWFLTSVPAYAFDDFPGVAISGSGSVVGTNSDATAQPSEPTAGGNAAFNPVNSIWYSWTAVASGTLVVQTCGSVATSFDTVLGIYTGATVAALSPLGFNDDTTNCSVAASVNFGSSVTVNVTAGTTYRIQVDGYGGATGAFFLQYEFTPPAAITVLKNDGSATEGGDTASFQVRLGSVPTANVTVNIAPSPSAQCTFVPTALTFTTANWNVLQQVTVTAVNDVLAEGAHTCSTGAITAVGGGFTGVTGIAPTFTITDNDTAALILQNTDSTTTEAGLTGTFTVRLATLPTANVSVTIGTSPQCTFATSPLTFTTANWNANQTVTVTAINDALIEGPHSCVTGAIAATGGGYTGVTGSAQTFTIVDNDVGGIIVVSTVATATEGGANGAFTVVLTAQPATDVTVTIATGAQCTFLPSPLTFTTGNWNTAQTVTTTAINDLLVEGAHSCTTGAITAAGSGYSGVTGTAPTFTITDNDTASLLLEKTANTTGVTAAGAVISYTIKVTNTGTVIATGITITDTLTSVTCPTSSANTIATLAPASFETCTANYSANQTDFDTNGGGDGDIDNTASAMGTAGGVSVSAADSATVLCTPVSTLTIVKSANKVGPLVVGDIVTYSFIAKNTGNVTLNDVSIAEVAFSGATPPLGTPALEALNDNAPANTPTQQSSDVTPNNGIWSVLKPNDEAVFLLDYTVTQADVDLLQ